MKKQSLWTTETAGGGGLNSQENFCVKEPKNGLNKGKSPNLKPAKNTQKFSKITLKNSHKNDENIYLNNNAKNNCINKDNKNLYNIKNNSANNIKNSNLINPNNYENSSFNKNEHNANLYQQHKNEIGNNNNNNINNFNLDNKDNCVINCNENIKNCDFNNINIHKINSKNGSTSYYNEDDSGITNTPNYKNVNFDKDAHNTFLHQQHQIKSIFNYNNNSVPDTKLYQVQNKLNNTTNTFDKNYCQEHLTNTAKNNVTSQNTLNISFPQKIIAIIVSLALIISLLGSGAWFLTKLENDSNAIISSNYTSIGNILKDSISVDYDIYSILMDRLGTKTGAVNTLDEGTPIVFTMADRDWQVVYRDPDNPDIITIWMTDYCTTARFHDSSNNVYGSSIIRTTVTNYYDTQKSSYPVLDNITASPNSMSDAYKIAQDQNGYYAGYTSREGQISTSDDKFWVPSLYETFSFWGLDATDRAMASDYCWLRSGASGTINGNKTAVIVSASGYADYERAGFTYGVRPAAHISLTALYNATAYHISATTENSSVDKILAGYIPNTGVDQIVTFTPNTNYYINKITIGATDGSPAQTNLVINNTAPTNYSSITNLCKYKVYRDGNTVKVVVNELTEHITIVGSGGTTIAVTNTSNITNISVIRADYNTMTGTVSATYANGAYPQFSFNSNTIIKISHLSSNGGGFIGSVKYSYTFVNNVLNLTLTNLPTGADNIPTLNLTAYTLDDYDITVNAPNCVYEIIYESTQIIIDVVPNSGRYITQAYVGSNAPEEISCYNGVLTKTGASHSIEYYANDETNEVIFIVRKLRGNLTLNLVLGNTKPILSTSSGTKIDGVALQTKLAGSSGTLACVGKATITGYTTTDGLDDVIVYATASAGYKFDHWEIDGTALDTLTYGISARIPYEMLDGKILVAVFAPNTSNTNDTTNTPDNGGFV